MIRDNSTSGITASHYQQIKGNMAKKQLILKITDVSTATTNSIKDELMLQGIKCDLVLIEKNSQTAYCYKSDIDKIAA